MNQETRTPGIGKLIGSTLLAILLAWITPYIILAELISLRVVLIVPAICTLLIYRWAGKAPALLCCILQMVFMAQMLSASFMWMLFCTSVLPLLILMRCGKQPFFSRMKISIAAFGGGLVASVAIMYSSYGGNMIERVMMLLPQGLQAIPAEMLEGPMQTLSAVMGREITLEGFHQIFTDAIETLVPHYQMNLPGLLFSGALLTAVLCSWIASDAAGEEAQEYQRISIRNWYLPASTTSGVLTMTAAAYIIHLLGMQHGATLYNTVYCIALTVFCIQALASIARRLNAGPMKKGTQRGILIGFMVLCLVDATMATALFVAVYGCLSALFGRRGSLRPMFENKNNQQ